MTKLFDILSCVAFMFIFVLGIFYGMDKEIERREAELAYHVQRCDNDPNYYPDFCKSLMGE